MQVEGDVGLDAMVWITGDRDAARLRALAAASPTAEWISMVADRARVRFAGSLTDVEVPLSRSWTGLVTGRVRFDDAPPRAPFRPYVIEHLAPALALQSCWFAVDVDGRVACFDRDQLGAAPIKRCRGPRPPPPVVVPDTAATIAALAGSHGHARAPARALTFVADPDAFARALERGAPQAIPRRWIVAFEGDRAVFSTGAGTTAGDALPVSLLAWIHGQRLCLGCARASVRDPRLAGAYLYQHSGRARAAPYDRVGEPNAAWSVDDAAKALGLAPAALLASALPVRFSQKDRLQPIEYVACTWSETIPWETESGEHRGGRG